MNEEELLGIEIKLDEHGIDEELGDAAVSEGDVRDLIAEVRRLRDLAARKPVDASDLMLAGVPRDAAIQRALANK